jgi:hypothetical protein
MGYIRCFFMLDPEHPRDDVLDAGNHTKSQVEEFWGDWDESSCSTRLVFCSF